MKKLSLVAILVLSACAASPDEKTGWRDMTGKARGNPNLSADLDACKFDMNRKNTVVPPDYASGPGPALFAACMKSRGWQRVY